MFFSVSLLLRGGGADGRGISGTGASAIGGGPAPRGQRRAPLLTRPGLPGGASGGFGAHPRAGAYARAPPRPFSAGRGRAGPRRGRSAGHRGAEARSGAAGRREIKGGGETAPAAESEQRAQQAAPGATACGEMSNVRISNGSPTLERMEARQSEYPKPSACRNLFGPVNHEELNRELKKHLQEMEEAYQRKWNFDFQNHRPLEGRYEWQAVEKGSSPDFYFRPPRLRKAVCKSAGRQSLDVNGNCQSVVFVGSQGISEDTHCVAQKTDVSENQTDLAEQCTAQRKRPAADDSSPQNKRANTTEEEVSEDSPSASSVEQTPKKSSPGRHQT